MLRFLICRGFFPFHSSLCSVSSFFPNIFSTLFFLPFCFYLHSFLLTFFLIFSFGCGGHNEMYSSGSIFFSLTAAVVSVELTIKSSGFVLHSFQVCPKAAKFPNPTQLISQNMPNNCFPIGWHVTNNSGDYW